MTDARLPEKGLGLALEILEQVARDDAGATAADLARAVGAPRATVYRVVNSLVRDEYLVRRADFSGFLLGARVLELAALVGATARPSHAPVVERLRADTGEAVHVFRLHAGGIVVVDEDPTQPLTDRAALLADPTASAIGHLWLLTHAPGGAGGYGGSAPREMREAIAEAYAVRGYTEQVAALAPDRGCLAVPIIDDDRIVGAVTLSTTIAKLSLAARHVGALRDAAASIAPLGAMSER